MAPLAAAIAGKRFISYPKYICTYAVFVAHVRHGAKRGIGAASFVRTAVYKQNFHFITSFFCLLFSFFMVYKYIPSMNGSMMTSMMSCTQIMP